MRERCPTPCYGLQHAQGKGCECCRQATRTKLAAIAWRVVRWFRETPEQPALIFIGIVWTWLSVENCPHLTSIWPF